MVEEKERKQKSRQGGEPQQRPQKRRSEVQKEAGRHSEVQKEARRRSEGQKEAGRHSESQKETRRRSEGQKETRRRSESQKEAGRRSEGQKETRRRSEGQKEAGRHSEVQKEAGRHSEVQKEARQRSEGQKEARRRSEGQKEAGRRSEGQKETRRRSEGQKEAGRRSEGQHNSRSKAKKRKGSEIISVAVLLVAVCVFVFSAYQLVMMLLPYYFGGKDYEKVKDLVITTDKTDPEKFEVNFDILLEENPDTVAWIRFEEPSIISYPVVKSKDNEEYLTKTFTANDNKLGAIFMDMRNASSFSDRNTLIYGHNLKVGGEMFSQLSEYADEDFCRAHPYFYIYTPNGKELMYQVFSAGVVKDTAENYKISYDSEEAYLQYLELCKNSSNYTVDVELNAQSRIVSLSTCTNVNDDERFLLQGVLIEEK